TAAIADPSLTELVSREGPFLTVYLTTEAGIDNAAQRSAQRWKSLRTSLENDGVPGSVLNAVDPLVADAHLHGECLGVVLAGDHLHVEHLPDPPKQDVGIWRELPALAPLLEWRQSWPAHVV